MYTLNEQLLQRMDDFVTGKAEKILVIVAKDSDEVRAAIKQSCENHQLTLARDCHYAANLPIPTSESYLTGDVLLEDFIGSDDLCDFDRIINSVIELKMNWGKPIIVIGGFDATAVSRRNSDEQLIIERLGELSFADWLRWAKADNPQLGHPNIHPLITSFLEHNPGKFNAQIQHGAVWHIVNTKDWQYISDSIYHLIQQKLMHSDPVNYKDERGNGLPSRSIDMALKALKNGILPRHLNNLDPNDIDDIRLIIAGTLACKGIADDFVAFHKGNGTFREDESLELVSKESAVESPSYLDDDGEPDWDKVHCLTFAEFLQWAKAYNPYKKRPNIHPLLTSFIEHNADHPILSYGYSDLNVIAVSEVGVGEWYLMSEKIYFQNKDKLKWLKVEGFQKVFIKDGVCREFLGFSSLEQDNLDDIKHIISKALRSEQIGEEFIAFHKRRK